MLTRNGSRLFMLVTACFFFQSAAPEEIRDYYAEPGINPFKESLNQQLNEHVDPFSGTLQLKYTDVSIPGNGGLDINIRRVYTSLQTNAYPILSLNGLGWVMHFGRIVVPRTHESKLCNQALFSANTADNPSIELPDGGREILALNGINDDASLITRSNWRAQCTGAPGLLVHSPDGTKYVMDRFDLFQNEPSWLTTRIEDVHGNSIRIEYATNAAGVTYISGVYRGEESAPVIQFEYEDAGNAAITLHAIVANGQRWEYRYQSIPGFLNNAYKQLVEVIRPDGLSWHYAYNGRISDPDPNDGVPEDGLASFSLNRVTYPYGAAIDYTYQFVQFDPGSALKTTAVQTKSVSGGQVANAVWSYQFAPHSHPFDDNAGGQLRHDVTTVTAPDGTYKYFHFGKDFRPGPNGSTIFIRPAAVGVLDAREIHRLGGGVIERVAYSWDFRQISDEDYFHGSAYRAWWHDSGTFAPVLTGELVNRDTHGSHLKRHFDHDDYGNPGRVIEYANVSGQPDRQIAYTYFSDTDKWIIGLPQDETHEAVGSGSGVLGHVNRTYSAKGQLLVENAFGVETRYTYTAEGDIETTTDARGNVFSYSSYKRGIAQHESHPESVHISRIVNDTGTLQSETNGRGFTTSFQYDGLNRLTAIDYSLNADVTIAYNTAPGAAERVLTRGNYEQIETVNDFGQVRRTQRRDLTSGQIIFATAQFDAVGRQTFASYPNDTIGTASAYDALGRIERGEHPDGSDVTYEYDGPQVTVTNERGFVTVYRYLVYGIDYARQLLVSVSAPEGVGTVVSRDALGKPLQVVQGERQPNDSVIGYAKKYRYDGRQFLIEADEPEAGIRRLTHDAVGNVLTQQIGNAAPISFTYDALNRLTHTDFTNSTADVVTTYDRNDNVLTLAKGLASWSYTYDQNDNLLTESLTIAHPLFAPRVYSLGYAYSVLDALTQTTYPSGLVVDFAPNAFGRATRVGSFASNIVYHAGGQVSSYTLANGIVTSIALDQRLRTRTVRAGSLVDLTYTYDPIGNVTSIGDAVRPADNVGMSDPGDYDGLDRLTSADGSWGVSQFAYDQYGNVRTKRVGVRAMTYRHDRQLHVKQLDRFDPAEPAVLQSRVLLDFDERGSATGKRQYNLDGLGFITNVDERAFAYDAASDMIKAVVRNRTAASASVVAEKDYAYDGNGQRVVGQKHRSHEVRFSVHSRSGQLMFEESMSGCVATDYLSLGSLSIARSDDRRVVASLDTDADSISDCMEGNLGLNPADPNDANLDSDGDGLTNRQELLAGTSTLRADTDGDGLADGDELNSRLTDPTTRDSDGDGLDDSAEALDPRVDPLLADGDHDGVSDFWELQLQTDPEDASDGMVDTDADSFSNRQESMAGSDPSSSLSVAARGKELWARDTFGKLDVAPTIDANGVVYMAAGDTVYAFNPDGTLRWRFTRPVQLLSAPTVVEGGTVYIVSRITVAVPAGQPRAFVYALDANGAVLWTHSTPDNLYGPLALGSNGRLYMGGQRITGSTRSLLRVLDANGNFSAGLLLVTSSPLSSSPAVAANGDVYLADNSGKIHAFTANATLRWTYFMRDAPAGTPSLAADGTLYVGDRSGYIYALTPAGTLKWDRRFSEQGPQLSSVTVALDGTLYIGAYESKLIAANPNDGSTLWSVPTAGTVWTPAVAADGSIHAASLGGEVSAFDAAGVLLWSADLGTTLTTAPALDRDGTVYIGSQVGQLLALAANGGGLSRAPWPMHRHDTGGTAYQCFNNTSFNTRGDDDGDGIEDCAEIGYGLDPHNPADGAADRDGDGLSNAQEHARGTNLDVADTDSDGLSDGQEVLTYNTDPTAADSDRDMLSDGREIELGLNPLVAADALLDGDSDGFSNRQENIAGTNPWSSASAPLADSILSSVVASGDMKSAAVGRDGTIYQNSDTGLEALYPNLTRKWNWPTRIIGHPIVGPDGTIYAATAPDASSNTSVVAMRPTGTLLWSFTFPGTINAGIYYPPVLGDDGTLYVTVRRQLSEPDELVAVDKIGFRRWARTLGSIRGLVGPTVAVARNGNVIVYGRRGVSAHNPSTGQQLWLNTQAAIGSGSGSHPAIDDDGTIYVTNDNGMQAVSATGTQRWFRTGARGEPVITTTGLIVAQCGSPATLCALARANGQPSWSSTATYSFIGSPTIDSNGTIHALASGSLLTYGSDGTLRRQVPVSGMTVASYPVILSDGLVYVAPAGKRLLIAGNSSGLSASPWPTKNRDHRNSRNAKGLADMTPGPTPAIRVASPGSGATIQVDVGQPLPVAAKAVDYQDGDISNAVRWVSSIDGLLGTGASLTLSTLSVGSHLITISITDSDGLSATDSFTANVVQPPGLVSTHSSEMSHRASVVAGLALSGRMQ